MRLILAVIFLLAFSYLSFATNINITGFIECPNTAGIRITDLDTGAPLSGAYVDIAGPVPTQDITGSSGELRYSGIPEGTYTISVAYRGSTAVKDLTYTECDKEITIDTELLCNNDVKVTVKALDDDNDKTITDLLVYLYDANHKLISSAPANLDGEAIVGPADDKQIFYVASSHYVPYYSEEVQRTFSYGQECLLSINTELSCDRSATITVIKNKTFQPIVGADITLSRTDGFIVGKTKTDGYGQAVYTNIVPGSYRIEAYDSYLGKKSIDQEIDFSYCPASGTISLDYQCNRLLAQFKNANGNPVAGGIITIYSPSDTYLTNPLSYASTDSLGIARLDIGKGSYIIVASDNSGNYASTSFTAENDKCDDIKLDHILMCPDLLLVKVSDAKGKKLKALVSLIDKDDRSSEFRSTNADGVITFQGVSNGQYTINFRDYPLLSKIINVDKSQCVGCANDNVCKSDQYCNLNEYKCEKLGGECGYPKDHKWVNYECCKDSDCSIIKRCADNICKDRKYELIVPDKANVSENTPIKAYEDDKPCVNCEISIEDPNGNKTKLVTGADGGIIFLANNRGDYKINLVRGNSIVSSKVSTASINFDSADPIKKITIILSDEKTRNLLVIMIVVIFISLYLYFRRKSGGKVKPENLEA